MGVIVADALAIRDSQYPCLHAWSMLVFTHIEPKAFESARSLVRSPRMTLVIRFL